MRIWWGGQSLAALRLSTKRIWPIWCLERTLTLAES